MNPPKKTLERLHVGQRFERSYHLSPAVYEGFIELFADRNPLHTDEAFARERGFEGRVMHGNILNGFLSHFVGEGLPMKNVVIQSQSIHFHRPVYLGEPLSLKVEVKGIHESVSTFELKFRFLNAAGEKVARGTLQIGLL